MAINGVLILILISCLTSSAATMKNTSFPNIQHLECCNEYNILIFDMITMCHENNLVKRNLILITSSQGTNECDTFIQRIISDIRETVMSVNLEHPKNFRDYSLGFSDEDLVIIIIPNRQSFNKIITNYGSLQWNTNAKFLFVFTFHCFDEEFDVAFYKLWEMRVLQVLIICIQQRLYRVEYTINAVRPHSYMYVASRNPFLNVTHKREITLETLDCAVLSQAYSSAKVENLYGYRLRTSTLYTLLPPYYSFWTNKDGDFECEGYYLPILQALGHYMNYTVKHETIHDWWKYGHKDSNGTWMHLIGDLVRRKVDLVYASLGFLPQRYEVIRYSQYIGLEPISILVLKGKRIPSWISLLRLFKPEVIISIFSLVVIQVCFNRMIKLLDKKGKEIHISQSILGLFSILMQESLTQPKGLTNRIIFYSWTYFSLVLSSVYAGGIISILTIPTHYPNMDTLQDVISSEITLTGVRYYRSFLNVKSNTDFYTLYDRFIVDGDYGKTTQSMVTDGDVAAVGPEGLLKYYGSMDNAPLFHMMKEHIGLQITGIGVPQGSPFIARFNFLIGKMRESGLISEWFSDELGKAKSTESCKTLCDEYHSISLGHIQGAFYAILLELCCALSTFILELLHNNLRKKQQIQCLRRK